MKKSILFILIICVSVTMLNAQDYIYNRDGSTRIAATDIKIQPSHTTYSLFGDKSGNIIAIDNNDISMIIFENGAVKYFEKESKAISRTKFKKNLINYHLLDLVVNNFKLSYERILSNGKIGIQIPISIGYGDYDNISGFDDVYNTFYTGVTLNFYPTGQGKVRYFMGPGIQVGTGFFTNGYYDNFTNVYVNENLDTFILRFLINNGIIFTPIDALSISIVGSLGIRYTDKSDQYEDRKIKTVGAAAINLSYRF